LAIRYNHMGQDGVIKGVTMDGLGSDFDDFVRESSTPLLRMAYLLTGDHGHAEDLLQTALLRTARRWRQAKVAPLPYARRVLANLAKDRWRNRGRRAVEHGSAPELVHDGSTAQLLLRHALVQAVLALPVRQRAVLVLRFFEDLSVDETAAVLGCSAGTVKSQTHRALATMRELLADTDLANEGDEPWSLIRI
jgi:RNA polymerase sigma-70 factor (sigma-E family)